MSLGDALRRFRKTFELTQIQAAKAAGVTVTMYQFYEYGKSEPTASVLCRLADYFDVSLDYLCGRSDDPARR
jgi:transcriptional regulator with XRE-family HTH domain